jgi:hypothetical protein
MTDDASAGDAGAADAGVGDAGVGDAGVGGATVWPGACANTADAVVETTTTASERTPPSYSQAARV